MSRSAPTLVLLISLCAACADSAVVAPTCVQGQQRDCVTSDGTAGQATCTQPGTWGDCLAKDTCTEGTRRDCVTTDSKAGEQSCTAGAWGACAAKSECTEGSILACKMPDGKDGTKICQSGAWTACATECSEGTFKNCTTSDQKAGTQACQDGKWGACIATDQPECKEGDKQACTTACGTGQEICAGGEFQNCDAPKPQPEVCDGVDNNCDGAVDEVCSCVHGKTEPCYSGPAATRGVGKCQDGLRTCDKGVWGPCTGEVLPDAKENCTDAIDDDCDGSPYNGCACTPGASQACGSSVGECRPGVQTCVSSGGTPTWTACGGASYVAPQAEQPFGCDGKDNDCSGVVDDGLAGDSDESNDDCAAARVYTVSDLDAGPKVLTLTLYPQGDVDTFKIIAADSGSISLLDPCLPYVDPECNYLSVELVQPAAAGVQYQASIMTGSCSSPTQTFTSTSTQSVMWDGICFVSDSTQVWVRVQATTSSAPTFSCQPYLLKIQYAIANGTCS